MQFPALIIHHTGETLLQAVAVINISGDTGILGYRDKGIQGYRDTGIQGYRQ